MCQAYCLQIFSQLVQLSTEFNKSIWLCNLKVHPLWSIHLKDYCLCSGSGEVAQYLLLIQSTLCHSFCNIFISLWLPELWFWIFISEQLLYVWSLTHISWWWIFSVCQFKQSLFVRININNCLTLMKGFMRKSVDNEVQLCGEGRWTPSLIFIHSTL